MAQTQIAERRVSDHIFTNLLASAYSVQQRQDRLKAKTPASKSDEVMSAVLDTQRLVWRHAIHPETAMQLIASRSQKVAGAAGAAIALIEGENLEYKVATGIATTLLGGKILAAASSSFQQLRSERVVESSTWQDKALGMRLVANSVLGVPVHRNGTLAGCLQLFSRSGQFRDDAVYTSELMSTILNQLLEETESKSCDENLEAGRNEILEGSPRPASQMAPCLQKPEIGICGSSHKLDTALPVSHIPGDGAGSEPDAAGREEHSSRNQNDAMYSRNSDFQTLRARARTIVYPAFVLLFVAIANVFSPSRDLRIEVASIFLLIVTAIELIKRGRHLSS